jgi:hypothetical protein
MRKTVMKMRLSLVWTPIIFALAACFVLEVLSWPIDSGDWEWWQPLGKPGAGAIRFWAITPDWNNRTVQIYVETANSTVRSCCSPDGSWEETKSPIQKGRSTCEGFQDPRSKQLVVSNLPSKIVDCTKMSWSMEWINDDDFFVILDDGSVWKWNYYHNPMQGIPFVCGLPVGAAILGLIIAVYAKKRQAAKQRREDETT